MACQASGWFPPGRMIEAKTILAVPEIGFSVPSLEGLTVLHARDGEEAFAAIEARSEISLVLLGIDLPGMDGFQTAARILASAELPIVFLSNRKDAESVARARSISRYGFVPESAREYMLDASVAAAFELRYMETRMQAEAHEKRQADRALKENLSLLQNIIDTSVDLIFVKDTDLRTVLCNEAFARAIGKKPWETYGKTDIENGWTPELVHGNPEKGIRGFEIDDRRALAGESVHIPYEFANVGSRILYFDTYKLPLRDDSGKVIGVLGISRNITERIETEQALRHAEERYRLATGAGRIATWFFDLAAQSIESGGTLEQMLGYTPGSFPETAQWEKVLHPEDLIWITPLWEDMAAGRLERFDIEHRLFAEDGSVRWVEVRAKPVFDSGRITGIAGTTTDITAQVLEREARQQSELQFRHVIDASPVPIALNDEHERITYLNQAFVSTFGYDLTDIPTLADWWPRAYPDPAYREWVAYTWQVRMDRAQSSGKSFEPVELSIRCKDGSEKTVIGTAIPPAKAGGSHPVLLFDITDRKKAEDALAREKERLRVTLQSIADAVITTDTVGRIVGMNEAAEILSGWKEADAVSQDIDVVFHVSDESTGEPLPSPVAAVLKENRPFESSRPIVFTGKDGSKRLVAESAAPIRESSGRTVGVVLVFRDVTERERLLENMQRTDKLDSLGVLAGGIAHDFNNLLASLFGYIELSREHSHEPAVIGYLDRALTAFHRARDLTQQLLTFARGGTPSIQPGHLDALIFETTAFILSGSNVACRYEIDPDLWACDFDPGQMTQVISNLVINAQQAMPHGGTITVGARNKNITTGSLAPGRYVEIRVSDTGSGIAPDQVGRIFDPFFSARPGGSGLGLATCHSIVQKHHGSIEVETSPSGSTFRVLIPASAVEPPRAEAVPANLRSIPRASGRILVMDDEELIREVAAAILTGAGYTVKTAASGEEALLLCQNAQAAGAPFDAAILDLTVPGAMGGREAASRMRELHPGILLFASSGYSEDPIMSDPSRYGFVDSIRKPYHAADLVELPARHIGK